MNHKYIKLAILPLLAIVFLSALPSLNSQLAADTSVISMTGESWALKVDSALVAETASKATPYMSTAKAGTEKELFLQLNSLEDCREGKIQFKVETQGLTVYKQLPLDKELTIGKDYDFINSTHAMLGKEIRVYRPENVVNSFACYDADGKKVLHIYASQLIDAGGNKVWVDSDLTEGVLTIYLDQKFLESAKYPVVVDPTFGYTSVGGTRNWVSESTRAFTFTLSEAGTVTAISAYVDCGGGDNSANYYYAIYSHDLQTKYYGDDTGVVGSVKDPNPAWVTKSGLSVALTADDYCLVVYSTKLGYYSDSGSAGARYWNIAPQGVPFPASYTLGDSASDQLASIYANYTAGAEPTATPTPTPTPTATPNATATPTADNSYSPTFIILILMIILDIALILINRSSTILLVLMLIMGIMTFAFGAFALTVSGLPFWPYFNIFVIVIGVLTMTVSIRGRN